MAGIGFALERLYRSNSLTDRMASFAHASIVAAGPCLLAVLCIWLISITIQEHRPVLTHADPELATLPPDALVSGSVWLVWALADPRVVT